MREQVKKLNQIKSDLLNKKVAANNAQDTIEEIKIDRQIAEVEIELCDLLIPKDDKPLFNPKKAKDIKSVSMEKVGINYIPFVKGAYNVLSGRGGSGKSAVALKSMMLWLRDNPKQTALAFFTEDGIEEIKQRAKTICTNSNLDNIDILNRINFVSLDNDDRTKWVTTNRDGYNINRQYINEVISYCIDTKCGYIILDPLKRFHSLNENSNDDMDILVRDIFTDIAVKTSATVLVLHHSSKDINGGARGAGTITDSARVAWKISRFYQKDNESGQIVENTEKRNRIKLEIIKDNLGVESLCSIRNTEDLSIVNPLNDFAGHIETTYEMSDNNFMANVC